MIDFGEPLSLGFIYRSTILNFKIWFLGFLLSKLWWLFLRFIYKFWVLELLSFVVFNYAMFYWFLEFLSCSVLCWVVVLSSWVLEFCYLLVSLWSSWFILCFVEFWCVGFQSFWVMLCCTMNNFVEHLFCIWCCFLKIKWIWEHLSLLLKD